MAEAAGAPRVRTVDLGEIPGALADSLRRGLGERRDVPVRNAATVVLLRDGSAGMELLVQRRVRKMAFAAGMTVFPGGAVEPGDFSAVTWRAGGAGRGPGSGPGAGGMSARLGASAELADAILVAAARETFEEVGILLAVASEKDGEPGDHSEPGLHGAPQIAEADGWRRRLERGESSFADLLEAHGLALDAAAFVPWAIWVTPVGEPRRFDTRFLLAELPAGQDVRTPASEADSVWWATPEELLDRVGAGELTMLPPTRQTLADLAGFARSADALAAGRDQVVRRYRPEFSVDRESGCLRGTLTIEEPAVPA